MEWATLTGDLRQQTGNQAGGVSFRPSERKMDPFFGKWHHRVLWCWCKVAHDN